MRRIVRSIIVLGLFLAVFAAGDHRARAQGWDNKGWVLLGQQEVGGRNKLDKDRITVGRQEGTFSKVTVVVENSDLEMVGFRIEFADRTEYRPTLSSVFKEGQRTKVIDLPPSQKAGIAFVDFEYRNLPGGGKAKVAVWGWRSGAAIPVVVPARANWDSKGWVRLGERVVNGRTDNDRFEISRYEGRFSKLMIVVEDSDLEMIDFRVEFGDRSEFRPQVAQYFRENTRTRSIDLPGDARMIRSIDFKYRNLPGGGRAKVAVWAFKALAPIIPKRTVWDTKGWVMLGERDVDGRVDRDRIDVGRNEGRFTKLTVVVDDSDLEMLEFKIQFGDRTEYNPKVAQYFRENTRTKVIDLPPSEQVIKFIDFKYRNLAGGGRAKVQVWGFKTAAATPIGRAWDSNGWVMLGERVVDGRRRASNDTITVGRREGKFEKLTLVVLDSDLELIEMAVKFRRGEPWKPDVAHTFRENTRTKVIDMPGNDARTIQTIDFKYKNLPGGGKARVQVWAK